MVVKAGFGGSTRIRLALLVRDPAAAGVTQQFRREEIAGAHSCADFVERFVRYGAAIHTGRPVLTAAAPIGEFRAHYDAISDQSIIADRAAKRDVVIVGTLALKA